LLSSLSFLDFASLVPSMLTLMLSLVRKDYPLEQRDKMEHVFQLHVELLELVASEVLTLNVLTSARMEW